MVGLNNAKVCPISQQNETSYRKTAPAPEGFSRNRYDLEC